MHTETPRHLTNSSRLRRDSTTSCQQHVDQRHRPTQPTLNKPDTPEPGRSSDIWLPISNYVLTSGKAQDLHQGKETSHNAAKKNEYTPPSTPDMTPRSLPEPVSCDRPTPPPMSTCGLESVTTLSPDACRYIATSAIPEVPLHKRSESKATTDTNREAAKNLTISNICSCHYPRFANLMSYFDRYAKNCNQGSETWFVHAALDYGLLERSVILVNPDTGQLNSARRCSCLST